MLIRHAAVELRKVNTDRVPKVLCVGGIVGKISEASERELVLLVSVRCGKNET